MSTGKPTYEYESAFGGKQEVEIMISAYTANDNVYVGLKAVEPDGSAHHFADLTVNIPSAEPLTPFCAAIDIEHLGQLDAMNFLTESGLAAHTGEHLPSGYMAFPVYEFDPAKLAEADPKGFKDYLKIVGLEEHQIEENSIEDLASMAKARFIEKTAGEEPELPFGNGSPMGSFEQILEALRDDGLLEDEGDEPRPPTSDADLPDTGKPFLDYDTSYDAVEKVNLELGTYKYGNGLYVGLSCYEPELEDMDFYGDVTTCILPLEPFMACVDTNNNNAEKITAFLTENGIAEPTGRALSSGFCTYPVFRFSPEKLAELDPKGFAQHCKDAGIKLEPKARDAALEPLQDLKERARERADERSADSSAPKPPKSRDMEL